ncbi:MAG: 50S ribosomal protein L30e [Candidatus Woesearchaeota archaeon]
MTIKELKAAIKENKVIMGTERTIKDIKRGKPKEVFIAKNCQEDLKKQIKHYCKLSKITLTELDETNEELGTLCKKPFSINMCYC